MAKRKVSNYKTDRRRKHHHWLVTVTYSDNESFGRVYIDRERAEKFAARQKKSPAVKSVKVQSFIKDRYAWQASRKKKKSDAK